MPRLAAPNYALGIIHVIGAVYLKLSSTLLEDWGLCKLSIAPWSRGGGVPLQNVVAKLLLEVLRLGLGDTGGFVPGQIPAEFCLLTSCGSSGRIWLPSCAMWTVGGSWCVDAGLLSSAKNGGRCDVGPVCSSARTLGGEEVCVCSSGLDSKFTCRQKLSGDYSNVTNASWSISPSSFADERMWERRVFGGVLMDRLLWYLNMQPGRQVVCVLEKNVNLFACLDDCLTTTCSVKCGEWLIEWLQRQKADVGWGVLSTMRI